MNVGILYGQDIDEDSEEAKVAAEVYDADQIIFLEVISPESIKEASIEFGCHSETVLIVTNDNLGDMGLLRNLYANVPQLDFVQNVKNLRKHYHYMFQIK